MLPINCSLRLPLVSLSGPSQVEARRKTQLRPYESFLKAFQYKNALNAALEVRCRFLLTCACFFASASLRARQTRDPLVVVSLIEELRQRDGLQVALAGRLVLLSCAPSAPLTCARTCRRSDETTLEPLVAFVAKYITHPRYSSLLITISNALFGTILRARVCCVRCSHRCLLSFVRPVPQICTRRCSANRLRSTSCSSAFKPE